jgi:hypothetical protein
MTACMQVSKMQDTDASFLDGCCLLERCGRLKNAILVDAQKAAQDKMNRRTIIQILYQM